MAALTEARRATARRRRTATRVQATAGLHIAADRPPIAGRRPLIAVGARRMVVADPIAPLPTMVEAEAVRITAEVVVVPPTAEVEAVVGTLPQEGATAAIGKSS